VGSDPDKSLSDEATFAGAAKRRPASEVSIGDERTLGDNRSGRDTIIDDIEVVDLESRYKVEGTLGQGGMGAVLLATDTRLDRKVAIKRILGEAAGNRMAVQRFLTEAKSIAALNHPNIVQIYDYGRAKDGPFLIMEYVDGGSLLDRCCASALPLDEAIDLACQLCDGLAKAHDLGIIHRDIKPANVLLTKDGIPKLTDFGLAKAQASDHGQTMTGAVLGTPDFMPPEQRRDASLVDHRSDLWSLAATIYQMATGRSPKIIRFDLLPAELTKALGKALEDEKDARYQSVKEFREALRTALVVADPEIKRGAVAEPQADLGAGECPKCHIVNDSQRKFCRECAASLRTTCLACETPIPIWDKVCPECGKKQPELLAARRATLDQQREEAEALLGALRYEEAVASADAAQVPNDDRFSDYGIWRDAFITAAKTEHATAIADRTEKLEQAKRHRAAFDYPSAIHALEAIPEQLRSLDASELLNLTRAESDEATSLLASIRNRIAVKDLDELAPLVQRAMVLRGDRQDLPKLLTQLIEREQRIAARDRQQREWVKATFLNALQIFREQGDPKTALNVAAPIEQLLDRDQIAQLAKIRNAIDAEKRLGERLIAAKADGAITTHETVELAQGLAECLALMPKSARLLSFRDQLIARINKAPNEFARHMSELRSFLAVLDNSTLKSVPEVLRASFLGSRNLVACPQCGVGIKASRLEWHLAHKCPGGESGNLRLDSIVGDSSLQSAAITGTFTNSIGMKFVPIPSGEFVMGSPANAAIGDPREEYQHRVRITKPFFLGMHQVTQAQYELVMGPHRSFFEGRNLPVDHITWKEAHCFCRLLSVLPAEQQNGRRYRLPTEAEWEYACRAGTTTVYNTGDSLTSEQARFCDEEQSLPQPTAPVGSYSPNVWGLFDMHGNVWEWTADWFSPDYYRNSPVDDPKGPPKGTHHTLRGGSASVLASECYSAVRGEASEDKPEMESMQRYAFIGDFGLRVVCEPAERK
jgi:formylglycine-generating enzyme required for sulfatase activity